MELAVYDLTQKIISINANWFKGSKHEIRLKSQFVALDAKNPISLISDKAGYLYNHDSNVKAFLQKVLLLFKSDTNMRWLHCHIFILSTQKEEEFMMMKMKETHQMYSKIRGKTLIMKSFR